MLVFVAARGRRARRALLLYVGNLGLAFDGGEFQMERWCDFDGLLGRGSFCDDFFEGDARQARFAMSEWRGWSERLLRCRRG